MTELVALVDGREMGTVRQERSRLRFVYSDSWRQADDAFPLSLSMPIIAPEHSHAAIEPFLWGLLPDNELVLSRWAQKFQVSARNPFALLGHVGEDCAGAVQFARPERVAALTAPYRTSAEWLTESDVAERLRLVLQDASAARAPGDTGQFSLAGAQPKTALIRDRERWGVPSGRTPTTHILKPSTPAFDGHAENEHVCMSLARALGLPTATSEVRTFEDVTAIVVTRYDRTPPPRPIRIHQEDMCQALRISPAKKYQNEGGPGAKQIVELLRANSSDPIDADVFIDALVFNWLIGGTDAHAKNFSVLIGGGGQVRLSPLYDVASVFAYRSIDPLKATMAMKIGDDYRLRDIGWANWFGLADQVGVDRDAMMDRARRMTGELPGRLEEEITSARASGLAHLCLDRLGSELDKRAKRLARL